MGGTQVQKVAGYYQNTLSPSCWSHRLQSGLSASGMEWMWPIYSTLLKEQDQQASQKHVHVCANAISLPSEVYRSPLSQVILVSGPYAAGLQAVVQTGGQKLELAAKFLHLTQLRPRPCRNHSSQGEKQLDICGGGRAGTLFFKHLKC